MAYRIEQTGAELQGILNDAAVTKQGLEDEVARAQAAEGGLQENIDSEAGERQSADALLAGNIGTEVARAQQAESDLGARVDANAAGVAAEVARAQEAEGQVWDTLNDEILTRQSQDAALQGNIEREAGLREAGDGQLQGEVDAISGKIPAEASEMNQLADKQYVQGAIVGKADRATTLAGYGIEDAYTKDAVDEMVETLSRNEVVVGALPQTGEEGVIYRVPGNGYYTDYMYYDGSFVELAQYSMEFDQTQVGYFTCDTAAGTAAKTVSAAGYTLAVGGNMRIKMTNANTAGNVTLNINGTGVKALYYDGAQASSTNTWEAGEIISVFYDGIRFMASNSQGGGGKAENIKYDNSQSRLAADNVQGALDEINRKTFVVDEVLPVQYTEGYYIAGSGSLTSNSDWKVSESLNIDEVSAGDEFTWGGIERSPGVCLVFYDDEGTFMQAFSATGSTRTFTIANDAAAIGATKVRASFLISGTPSLLHNNIDVLESNIHYSTRGIQDIAEELDSLPDTILSETESHSLNNSEFIQGSNDSSGNIVASSSRCITLELYEVDKNTTIEVVNNGQAHVMLTYDADGTFRGVTTGWVTADATYTFDAPHKVRFLVSWDGSTSRSIIPEQITVVFTFATPSRLVEIIDDEIEAKVGRVSISDNDSFCRYNKKIKVYNPYKDHPSNQYKGQMHCHTTNSDGGLAPSSVVAKYVGYGYDFMTITDHNYITPNPSPEADIVWMGDSYEDTHNSAGYQHMNVWNCSEVINRTSQYQTTNTPQSLVDHYVKQGDSVLSYNHPEYPPVYASVGTLENLPNGISFVEIYNSTIQTNLGTVEALPSTANYGDMVIYNGTRYINLSTTKASPNWQETTESANPDGNLDRGFRIMLDSGKKVFCDAVDDFHRGDNMENRGWQMVFANSRTRQSIWNGLLTGSSYASTGVYLNDVSFVDGVFKLDIADGASAVTTFYGYNNEVLGTANGSTAIYEVTGEEKYIRAMVEIEGRKAWTQPIWIIDVGEQYEF